MNNIESLGDSFGADLYEAEINYLIEKEWAIEIEDIIWRRTKRGLFLSTEQIENIEAFLSKHPALLRRKSSKLTKAA